MTPTMISRSASFSVLEMTTIGVSLPFHARRTQSNHTTIGTPAFVGARAPVGTFMPTAASAPSTVSRSVVNVAGPGQPQPDSFSDVSTSYHMRKVIETAEAENNALTIFPRQAYSRFFRNGEAVWDIEAREAMERELDSLMPLPSPLLSPSYWPSSVTTGKIVEVARTTFFGQKPLAILSQQFSPTLPPIQQPRPPGLFDPPPPMERAFFDEIWKTTQRQTSTDRALAQYALNLAHPLQQPQPPDPHDPASPRDRAARDRSLGITLMETHAGSRHPGLHQRLYLPEHDLLDWAAEFPARSLGRRYESGEQHAATRTSAAQRNREEAEARTEHFQRQYALAVRHFNLFPTFPEPISESGGQSPRGSRSSGIQGGASSSYQSSIDSSTSTSPAPSDNEQSPSPCTSGFHGDASSSSRLSIEPSTSHISISIQDMLVPLAPSNNGLDAENVVSPLIPTSSMSPQESPDPERDEAIRQLTEMLHAILPRWGEDQE